MILSLRDNDLDATFPRCIIGRTIADVSFVIYIYICLRTGNISDYVTDVRKGFDLTSLYCSRVTRVTCLMSQKRIAPATWPTKLSYKALVNEIEIPECSACDISFEFLAVDILRRSQNKSIFNPVTAGYALCASELFY